MRIKVIFILTFLISGLANAQTEINLMPYPAEITVGNGQFILTNEFNIGITNGTQRLFDGTTRFLRRLDGRAGLFFNQNYLGNTDNHKNAKLLIQISREGIVELNEDESYELQITGDQIVLTSETDIGAIRGLETLLQLLDADKQGYFFPLIDIRDEPRFPWRGLLIDVCRRWMPMEVIKRNLDGMAAVKMNVLHLHLTEDQGFRIESKVFPKLHELGSNGNYFTQIEMKEIISYASDRGIRVVPEFDIPGHATSWFVGYPELASATGPYEIETRYGIMNPTIDPTKESTYEFLDIFLGEMAALFPDAYMHIGGDENNGRQWDANPEIQAFMKKNAIADNHELQSYFNSRILDILNKYGKNMMGWDEIFQPGISKDIMIQSWRGKEALIASAQKGYKAILSNGYYIDLIQPTSFHYLNDPLSEDSPLRPEEAQLILGGEATMWSEVVTPETVDSRIWPRTAAIAERLWSPGTIKDVDDMYRRLEIISIQLEELGLLHERNYEMMLRRLAGGRDIKALKTLTDVIEPVKIYERHNQGITFTTFSPYTRLVDAARPDAKIAREFRNLVDDFIETGDLALTQDIKGYLLLWVENHAAFIELAEKSPILKDAVKLSLDLSNLSKIGLQALSSSVDHDAGWKKEASIMLEAAKEPRMECELMVVSAVQKLVENSR